MRQLSGHTLWIGNFADARNYKCLYELEIRAIVDLAASELPAQPPRDFLYCRFPLNDGGGIRSAALLHEVQTDAGDSLPPSCISVDKFLKTCE